MSRVFEKLCVMPMMTRSDDQPYQSVVWLGHADIMMYAMDLENSTLQAPVCRNHTVRFQHEQCVL